MLGVDKDQRSACFFENSTEMDNSKYLCQFTTLLMDTVEELTMRVSQIEFVCHQQFPDLQTLSHAIQKKLLASMNKDLEWKKKEDSLLHQIEKLQIEKQHSQEQINQLHASLEETKEKLMNNEQLLNAYKSENNNLLALVDKLDQNEGIISCLKEQLVQKENEVAKTKERENDLLQEIELKDKTLEEEHQKRRSLFGDCSKLKESYKRLKSQYTFLTSKLGDVKTNMLTDITEDAKDIQINAQVTTLNFPEQRKLKFDDQIKTSKGTDVASYTTPSTTNGFIQAKPPLNLKSKQPTCVKDVVASSWKDTRSRQEPRRGDPHDDFLDTPLENLRNFNMEPEAVKESPVAADEEGMKHQIPSVGPSNKGFKYVEPVRRKAERDNLKGVDCPQCRKFYDAVLPEGGKNDCGDMHCEHHGDVSRHRYRYAPPMTPEGFWNIGFDSDL